MSSVAIWNCVCQKSSDDDGNSNDKIEVHLEVQSSELVGLLQTASKNKAAPQGKCPYQDFAISMLTAIADCCPEFLE